jgi:hypothetical protein
MRRPPIKSLVTEPEPTPTLSVLLDRFQAAGIALGEARARGSDYARAVALQNMTKARQAVEASVGADLAAPLLAEIGMQGASGA